MLAPWKKSYYQTRQHIKKQRHYFAYKGLCSQSYGFSISRVQMWELDNKNGWVPQNWCLWTVVLEKTVESPWTARRSNQSILKEISPEYSLEGLMLKLQYFGHLMQSANSLEKTLSLGWLKAGREGNDRGWNSDGITNSMDMSLSKRREMVKDSEVWRAAVHVAARSQTQLSNWTTTRNYWNFIKQLYSNKINLNICCSYLQTDVLRSLRGIIWVTSG